MIKKIVLGMITAAAIFTQTAPAFASCTTHTYMLDGRFVTCTTCCYGSNCNTTCF